MASRLRITSGWSSSRTIDGSPLIVRDDDQPEVIRKRLATYHEKTEPLVSYYEGKGVLERVAGERAPDEVTTELREILAALSR